MSFNLTQTSAGLPSPQPSFLTSHQKHDAATSVAIPVSASTHFRAISDSRPTPCDPLRGETSGHGETNGSEGVERGARVGRQRAELKHPVAQCLIFQGVFFYAFHVLVCVFALEREVESVGSSCTEMEGVTVAQRSVPDHFDEGRNRGSPVRGTDSPSKKKGVCIDLSQNIHSISGDTAISFVKVEVAVVMLFS